MMNMKVLAFQIGALGSAMAGGGGAAALVLPSEIDPVWAKTIRNVCVVVWLLGGALSVFSKWMLATIKAAEEAEANGVTQTVQLPPGPPGSPVAMVLVGGLVMALSGCCDEQTHVCTSAPCGGVQTPRYKVNADEK